MTEFIVQNIMTLAFSAVGAALGIAYKRLSKRMEQQEHLKDGMVTVLHHMLYDTCKHHLRKGFLDDMDELKEIEYIYNAYHSLGGNGTGTEIYNRVKKLEIKEEK